MQAMIAFSTGETTLVLVENAGHVYFVRVYLRLCFYGIVGYLIYGNGS